MEAHKRKEKIFIANFKDIGIMAQVLPRWINYFVELEHRQLLSNKLNKIIVAPPSTELKGMKARLKTKNLPIAVASQEISRYEDGNHTGEIRASLLKEYGVEYAIIGHSEMRNEYGLTPLQIREEIEEALKNDITPIVCVRNVNEAMASIDKGPDFKGIIAYEPECAIASGHPMPAYKAEEECKKIKEIYPNARVIYGGSVYSGNVKKYINRSSIDGVLVGKRSADPSFFGDIIQVASQ